MKMKMNGKAQSPPAGRHHQHLAEIPCVIRATGRCPATPQSRRSNTAIHSVRRLRQARRTPGDFRGRVIDVGK